MYSISASLLLCLWVGGSISAPPLADRSFFVMWNIPAGFCQPKHGNELNLSTYGILHNKNNRFMGEVIVRLDLRHYGRFPYYTPEGVAVNGGVPQNSSIDEHLDAFRADIKKTIPVPDFRGLAVFDWKGWQPLWVRNQLHLHKYKEASQMLVKEKHPLWKPVMVEIEAKRIFEDAAQVFMKRTLRAAQNMRPNALWGYHGLPACLNHQYKSRTVAYTGACPNAAMQRNEYLGWLWKASSAFYPNIYLYSVLKGSGGTISHFVRHHVQEAQRLAQVSPSPVPVIPYAGIAFIRSFQYFSHEELEYTIGESAAMGAHGLVLGEDSSFSITKESCRAIRDYVNGTLGNYVLNVTLAALLCSEVLCSGQGRCQRLSSAPTAYLNLPNSFRPASYDPDVVKQWAKDNKGGTTAESVYIKKLATQFGCACFSAWKGKSCNEAVK